MPLSVRAGPYDAGVEEILALYGDDEEPCGQAPRSRVRAENLRHAATAVVVRNTAGEIYIHRRTTTKDVYPGLYDFAAGGCVLAGEAPEQAAGRELAEELGIAGVALTPVMRTRYADAVTRYVAFVYEARWDGPVVHQPEEVVWGAWMPVREVVEHLDGHRDPSWPFVPDSVACAGDWLRAQVEPTDRSAST